MFVISKPPSLKSRQGQIEAGPATDGRGRGWVRKAGKDPKYYLEAGYTREKRINYSGTVETPCFV